MIKQRITFCFILLLCLSKLNSQNDLKQGRITYKVMYNKTEIDTTKIDTKNNEIKNKVLSIIRNATDVKANLYFKDQIGIYEVEKKLKNELEPVINVTEIFAGGNNTYYTDLSRKENIMQTGTSGKLYLVDYPERNWIITKEEKQIGVYKSFKAYLKEEKNLIVWFTFEIPVNQGPLGYNGLPGLILEMNKSKFNFIVTDISFMKIEDSKVMKPNRGEKISHQKYYDIFKF